MAVDSNAIKPEKQLQDWLARMNWASDGERNLFLLAGICCLLLPPLGIPSLGLQLSLLLLASHLLILLSCGACVKRKFAIASSLIVILSLVNLLLSQYSGMQHSDLLIYFFCALALLGVPFAVHGYRSGQLKARAALVYSSKDEYRWLLTEAPLLCRWRFHELLREKQLKH